MAAGAREVGRRALSLTLEMALVEPGAMPDVPRSRTDRCPWIEGLQNH